MMKAAPKNVSKKRADVAVHTGAGDALPAEALHLNALHLKAPAKDRSLLYAIGDIHGMADLMDAGEAARVVRVALAVDGRIDICVNNAGMIAVGGSATGGSR